MGIERKYLIIMKAIYDNFKLITYSRRHFSNTKVAVRFFSSFANSSLISSFLDLVRKRSEVKSFTAGIKLKEESGHVNGH